MLMDYSALSRNTHKYVQTPWAGSQHRKNPDKTSRGTKRHANAICITLPHYHA